MYDPWRITVSVSTNVKTNYFKGNRLVFKSSDAGTAMFNKEALKKGVRIANFAQRFFGKSTAVEINGKAYHLNTNSLNKYHKNLLSSRSDTKFTKSVVFKRVREMICKPLEKAGKPLSERAITKILSTASASASDYGTALCDIHENQGFPVRAPFPELAQAVRVVTKPFIEPHAARPATQPPIEPQSERAYAIQEAKNRLEEAGKSLARAQFNRNKADTTKLIEYFKTEGLQQVQEVVSFLQENKELIISKIQESVINTCAKKELPPEFTQQLLHETRELVSKVLSDAKDAYADTKQAIQKMRDLLSSSTEARVANRLGDSLLLLADLFTEPLQTILPVLYSLESTVDTANILYEQITHAYGIYTEAPTKKVSPPGLVKRSFIRNAVEMAYKRKGDALKALKKTLTSDPARAKSPSAFSSWGMNRIQSIAFENPEIILNEVKRLALKEIAELKAQNAASDHVLVAAEKELKAAKKSLKKLETAPLRTRMLRSISGLGRPRSVSQADSDFMNRLADDPWSLRAATPDSGHASPDAVSLESVDSGNASADAVSIGSQNLDTVSRESTDSGVADDGDEFFDASDGTEPLTPYVDPFGLD